MTMTSEQKSRKALIKERQQNSLFWQVIHLLGSLQLALLLLATIALACALATFTESRYDTTTAHAAIYKAPWFMAWLTVLCINLFAVTLTRWPWEKKHTGFIITHYGIILLLVGAMIGMTWGFEGNVTLHQGTPVTKITTHKSVIQIESPADSYLYLLPYDASIVHPSSAHPTKLPIPGTQMELIIDDFSNHLEQQPFLEASHTSKAAPALLLRLHSTLLHQEKLVPLTLTNNDSSTFDFFGLATIQLLPALAKPQATLHQESQLIAAHFAPIIVSQDQPSGVKLRLNNDGSLLTVFAPDGTSASYPCSALMNQKLSVGAATLMVKEYWPDFKLVNGKPTTRSNKPENPALRAEILFPSTSIEGTTKNQPWLHIALTPDCQKIEYQLGRGSLLQKSGTLGLKMSIPLGWSDWECTLLDAGPHEEVQYAVVPLKNGPLAQPNSAAAPPGFHAYLIDREHRQGTPAWIISGTMTPLKLEDQVVRIAYGLELKPVPFSIELLNFEIPRDEGTETPSDFRATVRFKDLKKGSIRDGLIHMNHPASFPGTFLANLTGINYKFSQAEWNPRDLEETTLQVLYDPGWLLKWIGSLAICLGIAMMFYPLPFRLRR